MRIAVVGVGKISSAYLDNLTGPFADRVQVLGCADLIPGRADEVAATYALPRRYVDLKELLADPDVELVLNLSAPQGHYPICRAAIDAGKHTYVEKPICATFADAQRLMKRAKAKRVRIGSAPDTFLGGGIQTCRRLIDQGVIGQPVAATAFMMGHGPESWHPAPAFYYHKGGGPMYDMGPYYLTALVNLLGPVAKVSGAARISFPERTITSQPLHGTKVKVEIPTHVAGVLEFKSGPIATLVTSFDVWAADVPRIEIYGSEGTLSVPDPNTFGGPIRYKRFDSKEWVETELTHAFTSNCRGIGVADMARAIRSDRPHRASGDLATHVLEIIHGIHVAAASGTRYTVRHRVDRPAAMPKARRTSAT